jgi:hypothetical protein
LQLVWLHPLSYYPPWQVSCLCSPCQTSRKREKSFKVNYLWYAVSLSLTCVYATQVHNTCVLVRSVCKAMGAYSCKGQKAQVSLQKSYLWSFLELLEACLTCMKRLQMVHVSLPKRNLSHQEGSYPIQRGAYPIDGGPE